ncbi:MAG TPA: rhodanese-like domain-containing protein [Thermoanaerobaculia bacterium]|nr:rhodanese-like domain-containing protein [Thermoanaerobaculia bacterium]
MKHHRFVTATVTILLLAGAAQAQVSAGNPNVMITPVNPAAPGTIKRINVVDAFKEVNAKRAVIVDVRSADQFRLGHIKGAINIPLSQLTRRVRELPFGRTVITYCACPAEETSGRAVLSLANHGMKNAAAMLGGYNSWKKQNLPIERSK